MPRARRTLTSAHLVPFNTPIDVAMLRRVVRGISSVGSNRLGFRAAGTPEGQEVAEIVADEMRGIGLTDVHLETVPVHMWRFREATLQVEGLRRPVSGASMAGAPATSRGGVTAEVVFVGDGRRSRLDRLDV